MFVGRFRRMAGGFAVTLQPGRGSRLTYGCISTRFTGSVVERHEVSPKPVGARLTRMEPRMLFVMMLLFAALAYVFERFGALEATAVGLMMTLAFSLAEVAE